jgi:hypothetical protein
MLKDHLDAAPDITAAVLALNAAAVEGDRPRSGRLQADHDTPQRRLAAARFADQAQGFSGSQSQIYPSNGGHGAGSRPVDLVDRVEFKQ